MEGENERSLRRRPYRRERYEDDKWRTRRDRGLIERGTVEVRPWSGDGDAARRRSMLDRDRDWSSRDRGWRDRNWNDRQSESRDWNADDRTDRDWSMRRPRQSWGAQSWGEPNSMERSRPDWNEDYSWRQPGEYRSRNEPGPWGRSDDRDWRSDDPRRERGWRGEYLSSYGSHDAPMRVGGYAGRGPKGY